MQVSQIYSIVNDIASEALGESNVLSEDLSNIKMTGESIVNAIGYDNFVGKIVDKVGKVIFSSVANRKYTGRGANIIRDSWTFGSILEKLDAKMPEAKINESWNLQDGASYDPNVYISPEVEVKYWNNKETYRIENCFTRKQVMESFHTAEKMNAFISMLLNRVEDKFALIFEQLAERVINVLVAETVFAEFNQGSGFSSVTGVKAVNLLKLYNDNVNTGTDLTVDEALYSKEFYRYASGVIEKYITYLRSYSTLFNVEGRERHTDREYLNIQLHNDFYTNAKNYLYADTFHDEFVKLPSENVEIVPFWQGSGTSYAFTDTSKIDVVTPDNHNVTITGVIGVMFDRDAVAVCNYERETESVWNPVGKFYKSFNDANFQMIVDTAENGVVFFME